MKFCIKIILTVLTLNLFTVISAQERTGINSSLITGKVLDADTKHAIEYANVVVLSKTDSSVVTGGVTDVSGYFNLNISPLESYVVEVRFIGYDTKQIEIQINKESRKLDLGNIFIQPSAINLSDVVVQGERSPVTYEIDKKVVNPDQMQTVISGNAADILENVPSVQVDIDGNVSLRGSQNFMVLIDGRPSVLDPQDALQQIAASSIEKIEIITNPSAKYDPEGTAGIINIILKKNTGYGLNGIVNANAGMYDSYGGDFLINYQNEGIKTNLGFDYNQRFNPGVQRQNSIYYYDDYTSTINSTGDADRGRTNYEGRGGIEFTLGTNDNLSFGGRVGKREGEQKLNQDYNQFSTQDSINLNYTGTSDRTRGGVYYSLNSNYSHYFDMNGHQLLVELFYSNQESDELTTTSEFSQGSQVSGRKTNEFGPSSEFRGKLDYSLPFSDVSKFEAGYQGEVELSDETNELFEYNQSTNMYDLQSEFSNMNRYETGEHALYSMYSNKIWELSLQAGLRTEFTYRTIEVITQNQYFELDRVDYFPSLHSSYKFEGGTSLMASYSRRIERPRGWALEPFPTWIDANNVRIGNPDLEPEFIDSYEAGVQSFIGESSFSTELYYRITKNKIEPVSTAVDSNITVTTFDNTGNDYSLGAELMFYLDPFDFWNINLMGNIFNYRVEGEIFDEPYSRESFNWQGRFYNTFKLWSSTQIQFNTNYNSPTVTSQGRMEEFISSDISVRQEIIKSILAVTFQVQDIFSSSKREFTTEGSNFYNYTYSDRSTPTFMLHLRYTFNNYEQKREGRGEENGEFETGDDFN